MGSTIPLPPTFIMPASDGAEALPTVLVATADAYMSQADFLAKLYADFGPETGALKLWPQDFANVFIRLSNRAAALAAISNPADEYTLAYAKRGEG